MHLNDEKFIGLRQYIEQQYDSHQDWEKLKDTSFLGLEQVMTKEQVLLVIQQSTQCPVSLTQQLWEESVDFVKKQEEGNKVVKLGAEMRSDVKISVDQNSAWQLYKKSLEKQKWSERSISNIKKSSFEILQHLSMDTKETGPIKGLVVGNVQSGKTANMAGLMAMAADSGFNYFIILSGVIENLRDQTSNRLYKDMNTSGGGNLHWQQVNKPSLSSTLPEHDLTQFKLGEKDRNRYFTVSLKNKSRLNALINWLSSDKNKAKQMKILIIDDEADQASVNTNKISEEDYTAINKAIRKLVNSKQFKAVNYISYTATPYANVLNETSEDSLYPKDFICLLEPSEDYIGPKEIFGMELPESNPSVDIVRAISEEDRERLISLQNGDDEYHLPTSFIESIHWFLLSVSAMRAIDYRKPISMLVHTSFKIGHHQIIAREIEDYLKYLKSNYKKISPKLKELYENESLDFKRSHFIESMENYSTKDEVPDYPKWEVVEQYLARLIRLEDREFVSHIPIGEEGEPKYHKGIHLVIDNSQAKADNQIVRLVYPKKNQMPSTAPAFIVVGGNTLSRGLTLEGLTTTYFLRTTNQADTLMQMARWFGYRKGYEIFPRVWLDYLALERFRFLAQMNEELRDEIREFANRGLMPKDYAPRIKNSANHQLIRITSNNKMQSAAPTAYNFAGFNTQTIYFERNESILKDNLKHTKEFLNQLSMPRIKKGHMVWNGVPSEQVKQFLNKYHVCPSDIKMSSLPALVKWVEENSINMEKWNIILSSPGGNIEETKGKDSEWNIHGYSPNAVERTQKKDSSSDYISNIGALRTPSDLLADIDEELLSEEKKVAKNSELQAVRRKYGYGNIPQLIIYRIDKGQMTEEEYREKNINKDGEMRRLNRRPLNFPEDIIGINIMIPGQTQGGDLATYISAQIDSIAHQNIVEEDYQEENEK